MISKDTIRKLAEERIDEIGKDIYIVDLKISIGNQIFLELDRESGAVSIDDCIRVSRNVEHNLDREVEDFSLEVSSAGLDQPFKVDKQYKKNVGREVRVQMFEHGAKYEGLLKAVSEDGITLETREKKRVEGRKKKEWVMEEIPLKFEEIKETKLIISF